MAYKLEWSPRAVDDIESIAIYIATGSIEYAKTVVKKIVAKADGLVNFPFAGRVVPEFDDENLREQFVYNYRIIYPIKKDVVTIVAVIHGKQLLELELQPLNLSS